LEPIWYNEGEIKMDPSSSYFMESASTTTLYFAFFVNDLIIISKELSHPFVFLWGGKALFQKILEALIICLNLEVFPQ
jgi:hypothetical protein